ncbi:LicD family protein [Terrisporobacter glycolicus]|uniref:LicD family protein n=1 Tax=Terrisporobacter glycolicus TaxID=36841 RepID=UPI000B061ABB
MLLRDFLNEFELDYAQAPSRMKEYEFEKIKNNKIIIIGEGNDTFTRSIVYSFLNLNDQNKLKIEVNLIPIGEVDEEIYTSSILERLDFKVQSFDNLFDCDFIICTGLCNKKIEENVNKYITLMNLYNDIFEQISKIKFNKLIFMSDYRINGKIPNKLIASEYEIFSSLNENFEQVVLQNLEALCVCYGKEYNFDYNILRCGLSYGPFINFSNNFLYDFIKRAVEEENIDIEEKNLSFVYINDILTAIFYAMQYCPNNKIFNIDGLNSTVCTTELISLLLKNNLISSQVNIIKNNNGENVYSSAINSLKLRRYGWKPEISLEDGLILFIKSIYNSQETFIFEDTYQGKLGEVHNILLAYLLEIDRICEKHNIKYFLAGGTLLGAIRHNGFIPWDDDADVMMLREDYDKFIKVVQSELPSNLFLQLPSTERLNHQVFAKIRINNTLFATQFTSKFLNMHNGIFVDILSQDKTGSRKLSQKMHIYLTLLTRSMVFNKWGNTEIKTGGRFPFMCKLLNVIKNILPMTFLEFIQNKIILLHKNNKKSKYLYDGMGRNLRRGAFPEEWLDEVIYVDFEGKRFPVPKEYDKYLTYLYGDYMQMIPVSERRVSHSIVLMDLGEYVNFKTD